MAVSSLSAMHLSLVVPLGMAPTLLGCPNFSLCNRVLQPACDILAPEALPYFPHAWLLKFLGGRRRPRRGGPGREYRLARMRARPAAAESDRHGVGAVTEDASAHAHRCPLRSHAAMRKSASKQIYPLFALSRKIGPVKEGHVLGHCVGSATRRHRRTNKDPGLVACGNCSRKHEADDEVLRSGHSIFDWLELNEVVLPLDQSMVSSLPVSGPNPLSTAPPQSESVDGASYLPTSVEHFMPVVEAAPAVAEPGPSQAERDHSQH